MKPGHVYVLAFSNGTVKVGKSQDAPRRIGQHKSEARKFNLTVTDEWTSPLHVEWDRNEDKLKAIATSLGGVPAKREYFSGIAFAAVVDEAQKLPFTEPETAAPKTQDAPAIQPESPPFQDAQAAGAGFGCWVATPGVLATAEGRLRLLKVCHLLDIYATADTVQRFTLHQCIADEFTPLLTKILSEGARVERAGTKMRAAMAAAINEAAEAA